MAVTPPRHTVGMCLECDGWTPEEIRQHTADCIDWYGWAVQMVEPSPRGWGWAYTLGLLERFGHPELVMVGRVHFGALGGLINQLGEQIQRGGRITAGGVARLGGDDFPVVAVHPGQYEHGLFNLWFDHYQGAGPDLRALQILLPPEPGCPDTALQPRLDQPNRVLDRVPTTGPPGRAGPGNGRRRGYQRH